MRCCLMMAGRRSNLWLVRSFMRQTLTELQCRAREGGGYEFRDLPYTVAISGAPDIEDLIVYGLTRRFQHRPNCRTKVGYV